MITEGEISAWKANNAINVELLGHCPEGSFDLKPIKGKTIRSNFVHIVGVRKMWCEDGAKEHASLIPKLDWKTASREELVNGLTVSSEAMLSLFEKKFSSTRSTKWNPTMYLSYCIAHEAHHRSQIEMTLRIHDLEPSDAILYGLWDWPRILEAQ